MEEFRVKHRRTGEREAFEMEVGTSEAGNQVPPSNMVRLVTVFMGTILSMLYFNRFYLLFPGVFALFWIEIP